MLQQPPVPDQFEMARRALVQSIAPDGAVHVANDPSVGSSPFLYGRAKPQSPLERQMQREQQRQVKEQQRYDAAFQELNTIPQWQADRMGPEAAIAARQRGAAVANQLPQPMGTPMSDAYAAGEQDIANIPRVGAANRGVRSADTEAAAQDFLGFDATRARQQSQLEGLEGQVAGVTDPRIVSGRQEGQKYDLLGRILQGLATTGAPVDPGTLGQLARMLGLSFGGETPGGAPGGAPEGASMGGNLMDGSAMTRAQVAAEAAQSGVDVEDLIEAYQEQGFIIR